MHVPAKLKCGVGGVGERERERALFSLMRVTKTFPTLCACDMTSWHIERDKLVLS